MIAAINKKLTTTGTVSPLFNYVGGKTWLREVLREATLELFYKGQKIVFYMEPFVGGMGAFLCIEDILYEKGIKEVHLNDINPALINFYKVVKYKPDQLYSMYTELEKEFNTLIPKECFELHKTKDKIILKEKLQKALKYYYQTRIDFSNEKKTMNSHISINVANAVKLLFLQNHCFNGIYRENNSGQYNTSFNWEATKIDYQLLKKKIEKLNTVISKFDINFTSFTFNQLQYCKNGLYYLDPPYLKTQSESENKYHKSCFSLEDQKKLIAKLKNCNFFYSNHYSEILIEEFNKNEIPINTMKLFRKNFISGCVKSRTKNIAEVFIKSTI